MSDPESQPADAQPTDSNGTPAPALTRAKGKPSNKSLAILAVLFGLSGVSVLVVPNLLQQAYYMEEESKREKNAVIVGTRTDSKPPPGRSTDPYAGMPSRQAANRSDGEGASATSDGK